MEIKREISIKIKKFLSKKMVLISGPRQVGKTFLTRSFLTNNYVYLNYDDEDDRKIIQDKSWPRDVDLIIFDELHKKDKWKTWLKSIFDKEGINPNIVVTGSARMEVFKKGGDSLAGRHFHVRLHPLSIKEYGKGAKKEIIQKMMMLGSFPEPLLSDDMKDSKLWRKSHLERIIKEDLLDLERVNELKKIEVLVQLLSERVGSAINYASLGRDLEVSSHTIKHWLQILENLYVIFKVTPLSKNIAKSILKAPKYYFYDTGRVRANDGAKLENIVACHLLKRNNYLEDIEGEKLDLFYIRDKEKREVDFAIERNFMLEKLIEVKMSDDNLSKPLKYFTDKLTPRESTQIVFNIKQNKQYYEIKVRDLTTYLYNLEA
ncbi:MAG: ATP-binding protein [Halobacteriovoraceae bacterium]|nr:ATP-binding protein [Halobacteriovoraceae bacterium]